MLNGKNVFWLGVLSLALTGAVTAQPADRARENDSFILAANKVSAKYTATYLGNGNLGVSSSQLGTLPTHSYMAWIYEHYPGDVARNASLPGWNAINYFNGKNWLNDAKISSEILQDYRQTLDMYDAVLNTRYKWNDNGKITGVEAEAFVSRANPNLAVIRFEIIPNYSGKVKVDFPIHEWPEPQRMKLAKIADIKVKMINGLPDVWYPGHMKVEQHSANGRQQSAQESVVARPDGDTTQVAIACDMSWSKNVASPDINADTSDGNTFVSVSFDAKAGVRYTFYKYVGIVSSRESGDPLPDARRVASMAALAGYEKALTENEDAWHQLWKTDITITGNPQLQKVIHSSMFYLLCSARKGSDFGIPPMGLSSDGYYGHIFWDSDTWMFPPLLLMHPNIAKSMVMFRYKALPAAEANAKLNGYKGAMYPWESDENGEEACPKFAYQNALYENHVTGDVAFAQWQYFLATGDTAWLSDYGYPVIKATADFWKSRATFDPEKNRYDINKVVSVDEGLIGVNDDAYTNLVARRNLEIAMRAAELLRKPADPQWQQVAEKLYIPYDSTKHCYLTYENAPPQSLGAVVPLLYYPLELSVPENVKANDLTNALDFTKKNGSGVMMGITLYQIVAAEIQNRKLFDDFFNMSYKPYIRGAFNVFAETPENMSTNFLTGAGGFLQQVLFGYTGLRITEKGLVPKYKPMLPRGVREVTIRNIHFRGKLYDVVVKTGKTRLIEK